MPPPSLDIKLLPSSADRALIERPKPSSNPNPADGSRITVYLPGSIAFASRDITALSIAIFEASAASNFEISLKSLVTHPEPVPSLDRMVTVNSTLVDLL